MIPVRPKGTVTLGVKTIIIVSYIKLYHTEPFLPNEAQMKLQKFRKQFC